MKPTAPDTTAAVETLKADALRAGKRHRAELERAIEEISKLLTVLDHTWFDLASATDKLSIDDCEAIDAVLRVRNEGVTQWLRDNARHKRALWEGTEMWAEYKAKREKRRAGK